MHSDITTMKMRPTVSRQANTDQSTQLLWPEHAKHLEYSCTAGSYASSASRGDSSAAGASGSKKALSESISRDEPPVTSASGSKKAPSESGFRLPRLTVYVSIERYAEYDRQVANVGISFLI
jgi:hypothetical protein